MGQISNRNIEWLVCVRCYTYNHSSYIIDAMNGFAMQQTDFPFVCCIVDDASTDNEQKVISKYIDENFDFQYEYSYKRQMDYGTLIFARHKTNHNCFFAVVLLKENHNATAEKKAIKRGYISEWELKSKYEALCEGDDYWTDSNKLQKQVDFLESHPDYTMCFHNAITIMLDGTRKDDVYNISGTRDYSASDILRKWTIPTASVVFRTQNIINDPIRKNKNFKMGDNVLFLTAAKYGRIYGFDEYMSIYRRNYGGATVRYGNIKWARVLIDHYKALDKVFSFLLERGLCKEYIAEKYIYLIRLQRKEPIKVLREVSCALRDAPIQFVMGSLKAWIFK